jgi:hypothetical protein
MNSEMMGLVDGDDYLRMRQVWPKERYWWWSDILRTKTEKAIATAMHQYPYSLNTRVLFAADYALIGDLIVAMVYPTADRMRANMEARIAEGNRTQQVTFDADEYDVRCGYAREWAESVSIPFYTSWEDFTSAHSIWGNHRVNRTLKHVDVVKDGPNWTYTLWIETDDLVLVPAFMKAQFTIDVDAERILATGVGVIIVLLPDKPAIEQMPVWFRSQLGLQLTLALGMLPLANPNVRGLITL